MMEKMIMSDMQQPQQNETDAATTNERNELVTELQQLGQQLESTFRAFVAGPGQTIKREVSDALQEMGTQVQRAVSAIQARPETAGIEQKARRAIQQVGEKPIVREVEETLVSGVQQINLQLRKLVERLETQESSATPSPSATTQRLMIEDESGSPVAGADDDQPPTNI
jgi:hypothetical protein